MPVDLGDGMEAVGGIRRLLASRPYLGLGRSQREDLLVDLSVEMGHLYWHATHLVLLVDPDDGLLSLLRKDAPSPSGKKAGELQTMSRLISRVGALADLFESLCHELFATKEDGKMQSLRKISAVAMAFGDEFRRSTRSLDMATYGVDLERGENEWTAELRVLS